MFVVSVPETQLRKKTFVVKSSGIVIAIVWTELIAKFILKMKWGGGGGMIMAVWLLVFVFGVKLEMLNHMFWMLNIFWFMVTKRIIFVVKVSVDQMED